MIPGEDIKKEIKVVEWQIADKCNYHCSYCSTKPWQGYYPKIANSPWQERYPELINPQEFLNKLHRYLKGSWLVYLGGYGEPFTHPEFFKIVKKLVRMNYYIGLVTNLSYPLEDILKFLEITKGKLFEVRASLHLEFVSPESFLKKAIKIKKLIGPLFMVTTVAKKEMLPKLLKIGEMFKKRKINFLFRAQKMPPHNDYRHYSAREMAEVKKKFNLIKASKNKKNKECLAGKDYFVMDNSGEAYFCFPYKEISKDINAKIKDNGYLGNILKGTFNLRKKDAICKLDSCFCCMPERVREWHAGN